MNGPQNYAARFESFIRAMPKAELHVHLAGTIQPETLLTLAERNRVDLPANTIESVREWYRFKDFNHFLEVYMAVVRCLRTPDDIELIAREFLRGQAAQNVRHTEITYGGFGISRRLGLPIEEQLAAVNRAITWAETDLGIGAGVILEIPREIESHEGEIVARWAVNAMGEGIVALGLGGSAAQHPPKRFRRAFDRAREAGLPVVPHAGEVVGAEGIWDALRETDPARIEHGVHCLEDPGLVAELRDRQIPLDVCPSSNVALGVAPNIAEHPLPRLMEAGLHVTLNSDDPPMFNTTLTDEYLRCAEAFAWSADDLQRIAIDGARAALLSADKRIVLIQEFESEIGELRQQHDL